MLAMVQKMLKWNETGLLVSARGAGAAIQQYSSGWWHSEKQCLHEQPRNLCTSVYICVLVYMCSISLSMKSMALFEVYISHFVSHNSCCCLWTYLPTIPFFCLNIPQNWGCSRYPAHPTFIPVFEKKKNWGHPQYKSTFALRKVTFAVCIDVWCSTSFSDLSLSCYLVTIRNTIWWRNISRFLRFKNINKCDTCKKNGYQAKFVEIKQN